MRKSRSKAVLQMGVLAAAAMLPRTAGACYYHWLLGIPEPSGVWPTIPTDYPNAAATNAADAVQQLQAADAADDVAVTSATASVAANTPSVEINGSLVTAPEPLIGVSGVLDGSSAVISTVTDSANYISPEAILPAAGANAGEIPAATPSNATIIDPTITSWMLNPGNVYGTSSNASINSIVSKVLANVQVVAYSSGEVYIKATNIPSYALGPSYGSDPNIPNMQNRSFEIPRTPTVNTGTKTATGLGVIGVAVNGVAIYNPWDANYYSATSPSGTASSGYWQQNADVFEASTFDSGPGHADQSDTYHYHETPTALLNQIDPGNTGQHASPVIGYASDGYPIFGPYGYVVDVNGNIVDGANGQPEVELMTSSYSLTNYGPGGQRPDGGPNVSAKSDGDYLQDYYYNAGSGTLNQYNMRYAVAPGYSTPTWGYYVTGTYPYIIGPDYYGNVDANDLTGGTVTVPSGVTFYTPAVPEPATGMLLIIGAAPWMLKRRGFKPVAMGEVTAQL